MGLGRLNPGCGNTCDGCPGCFGSIDGSICGLTWQTSGDVTETRLLRDSSVVSTDESGVIYRPEIGTYLLQVKCGVGSDWQTVDRLVITSLGSPCLGCCSGRAFRESANAIATLNTGSSHSLWSLFDGDYVLTNDGSTNSCGRYVLFPFDPPSSPIMIQGTTCVKAESTLFNQGFYLLTETSNSGAVYEYWAWPDSVAIAHLADGVTIIGQGVFSGVYAQLGVRIYKLRISSGFGECAPYTGLIVQAPITLPSYYPIPCGGGANIPFVVYGGLTPPVTPPAYYSLIALDSLFISVVPA